MSTEFDEELVHIRDKRQKTTQYFSLTVVIILLVFLVINVIYPSNFIIPLIISVLIGISAYTAHIMGWHSLGERITLIGFFGIIIYGTYISSSGGILSLTSLVILASVLSYDKRLPHIIFAMSIISIAAFVISGRMTIYQTLIQPYNISLSNIVQAATVHVITTYIVTIYIQKILVGTIEIQERQYKQLEELQKILFSQAQQEAIKLLAGGFSHDFNNILTILTGNLSLFREDDRIPEDLRECVIDMELASLKAKNLSFQLLNLTKANYTLKQDIFDVANLIEKTVSFSMKGSNSGINFEFDDDLWAIQADPVQISQVIQNLVINADQAVGNNGKISIIARNRIIGDGDMLPAGEYLEIHIIDNGPGISDDIIDNIFDIFFTTKDSGSGIGLAISKNIVEKHGGMIGVNSADHGSDFFVLLPAMKISKPIQEERSGKSDRKYDFTAIIYDDNKDVIRSLTKILRYLGLHVYDASDSESFIQLIEFMNEHGTKIDIFFLDLILPGEMGGEEMMGVVREMVNDAYIVISSGYSPEFILSEYEQYKFENILRKPYNLDDVREVLEHYLKFLDYRQN